MVSCKSILKAESLVSVIYRAEKIMCLDLVSHKDTGTLKSVYNKMHVGMF